MLIDFEPVNAVGDLAVRARLLDASTEVGVLQRDAALVAARRIDTCPAGAEPLASADRRLLTGSRSPRNYRAALLARTSP
jgi:hypothetical protein